uniref:Uncharacterized protein n=1 Tax=Anguilla anguilla TaxID=7936 RepID=A0A0E9TWY4_ANGAN
MRRTLCVFNIALDVLVHIRCVPFHFGFDPVV